MIFKNTIRISFLLLSLSQIISAQDSIQVKYQLSEDRIKSIENVISILPKIAGLVNLRHQYSTEDKSYLSGRNGFDVRRVYLDLRGYATKELSYRIEIDFGGTPRILDAYAEWKPAKFIGLQAGQFKLPFSLENPYSPTALETADNSQVIQALVTDIAGNKNNGRDIGIALNGNLFNKKGYNLIDYKVGLFNGNIINSLDNNTTKDVVGSILINPFKSLSIGASYYTGKFGVDSTKYTRNRIAYSIKYDDGKLLFRSEYLTGTTNTKDAKGYYVVAAYYVTKHLQPVLKYDYYQSDLAKVSTPITNYLVGLNYWITPKARLQFNYTYKVNKDPSIKDSNYFVTQLLLAF